MNDSHTHDLGKLFQLADLRVDLEAEMHVDPSMKDKLDTVQDWSETSGYEQRTPQEAADLLAAIEGPEGGLLPWIRLRW